jgi:polysaccharide biosynthesis/export protein
VQGLGALAVMAILAMGLTLEPVRAQQLPNLSPNQVQDLIKNATPEQLRQLQERGFNLPGSPNQTSAPSQQQPITLSPADARSGPELARSTLEFALSDRAGRRLKQFGYDQVGVGATVTVPQTGAVQDDYVLGPGDEVVVVLRGQENSEFNAAVNRNGQVVLPKTGPVLAAGKTLGEFRQDLLAAIQHAYVSTQAYISVGQLRQVTVMVAGEVANPGMRILTGLSNPLDAILLSGGVKKSGSLRDIRLIRHGQTITVDLYGVLTRHNNAGLVNLQDGDRVLVPALGATVAIAGYVRRPAIYELAAGSNSIRASELLALGNGAVLPGATTASILRIMPDGKGLFVDVSGKSAVAVHDGEVMIVKSAVDISVGRVTLHGAVRTPGMFAVEKFKTLHQVLPSSDALEPGAYVLFGFIDRINQTTLQHEAIPFSPLHVIAGKEDVKLATDDAIYILTIAEMQSLLPTAQANIPEKQNQQPFAAAAMPGRSQATVPGTSNAWAPFSAGGGISAGAVSSLNTPPAAGTSAADTAAASQSVMSAGMAASTDAAQRPYSAAANADTAPRPYSAALIAGAQFVNKFNEYRFSIGGAVRKPGTYLAAPNTNLAEALTVLGGLTDDIDLTNFELTSIVIDNNSGAAKTSRKSLPATTEQLAAIVLQPYDQLTFRHVYSDREQGSVSIEGQVRYPGEYGILRAERLSSVLHRAGGLTEVAYPYGTVFLRQSVAQQQADASKKTASDIRSQLFAVLMRPTSTTAQPPSAETIVALQALLSQIESQPALGRVSFTADPEVLANEPSRDPVMEPGDRIVVPKRPSSISVLGEVTQPGAFPVEQSMSVDDYVEEAGGFTEFADSSKVIVVLPDGRAHVKEKSWLSFGKEELPPGTVIVVARNVTGITFRQLVIDTTQILSQLAMTTAAMAVLATNTH